MTSKEMITAILNWTQHSYIDYAFMRCLKQDLESLVEIARAEGADDLGKKIINHLNEECGEEPKGETK